MLPIQLKLDQNFFREEIRDGFLVTQDRKKIWAVELDLLAEFDRVCKKHNLTYFLDGGTLLGAVRHQGFIPWDDDVDVEMFREDYDRLLKIAKQEFKPPYFFQSAYSEEGYVRGHSQLRNSRTCGALPQEADHVTFNQGMFLDIFVLDGVPEEIRLLEAEENVLQKYSYRMRRIAYPRLYRNQKIKYMLKLLRKWICVKSGLLKWMYHRFELCAKGYPDSDWVYLMTFYKKIGDVKALSRSWYSETEYVSFEMLRCPIPSGYKAILKAYYGTDFMVPEKVPSTHGKLIVDTGRSYVDVLEERRKKKNLCD